MYKCIECKRILTPTELDDIRGIKCPYCGNRIFIKMRPEMAKTVQAR
ncbi:MAG: DNA-directed RNA polymerase subunit P [Candidatus Methanofastidiosum sp.]|nr:DNA-directed RNA polymerase subunit P [Methanofastidiosum sp.]